MKTAKTIVYRSLGIRCEIPAGTPVIEATNLPEPMRYWAESWPNMTDQEQSYQRNYGFLIQPDEVTK